MARFRLSGELGQPISMVMPVRLTAVRAPSDLSAHARDRCLAAEIRN
jgi:hypothetical protein